MPIKATVIPLTLSLTLLTVLALPPAFAQSAFGNDSQPGGSQIQQPVNSGSSAWQGQGFRGRLGGHRGGHNGRCESLAQLNLSPQQQQQVEQAQASFKQQYQSQIQDLHAKHAQMKQLMQSGQGQSSQATALRSQLQQEGQVLKQAHQSMLQGILTPQQLQQYETLKQQCREQEGPPGGENPSGKPGRGF